MTAPVPGPRQRGARASVALLRRNRDFRLLFSSSVVSLLGDWFALVAVSGLVTELTGSPAAGAIVFAASVLPVFLLAPVAGVVADRVDRRRLMIVADLARIAPALGFLVASVTETAWVAIACMALIAALSAFFEPVVGAATPNLVDRDDLSLAQTLMGSVWGTMLFVGAGLGGIVAATLGREAAFLIDAATFAVSAGLIVAIRRPFRAGPLPERASVLAHLGEVWSFVAPRKITRALMVTKAGVGVANGIVGLLPFYAVAVFGAGDAGLGLLLAARGLGALVGPFVGRAVAGDDGRRLLLVCGSAIVAYGVAYVFLPLTGSLALAALFVALAHAGGGAQWVLSTYGLQVSTPDEIRGRVMSLDFGLATLAIGVSSLLAGAAADVFGVAATSAALVVVAVAYGSAWLWWTRDLWQAPEDPLQAAAPPAPWIEAGGARLEEERFPPSVA